MTPRSIVITGASNGIGSALAINYATQGNGISLGLIGRNQERLESVAQTCRQLGATVNCGQLDITDTSALTSWIQGFDQNHPIELLIANAGITLLPEEQETESLEQVQQLLDVNLHGVIHTVYAILEPMRQRGNGQIALVSSLAAYRGMPVSPAYCASKAAIKSYGEALRGWLAPEGIQINVICPGFVASDMTAQFKAPKPFMITAERAAHIIQKGLARNQANISFPFPLNLGMWFVSWLPFPIASFFLGLSGYNRSR